MESLEKLGIWIANNPIAIIALAVLLTLVSLNYAQQIQMQGMATESFVGKDSPLYQIYDHLFVERFGTTSIVVLIEGDDIARRNVLLASLRLSDHMKEMPKVLGVQSVADMVVDAEAANTGIRELPSQEKIDSILSDIDPEMLIHIMPDRRHSMLSIEMPLSITEAERDLLLADTNSMIGMVEFPAGIGITVTGNAALDQSIMTEIANSNGPLLGLSGVLMIVALFLVFRHVQWPLLPLPIVFLGIIWTFGAMGFLRIPLNMASMSAFPVLIGIGIDYAIQFHNRIDEEFGKGANPVSAVVTTVRYTAGPVIIALIITAAGFFSLLTSSVPMIRDFGLLCLIGLFMCYLSALFVGVTVLYAVEKKGLSKTGRMRKNGMNGSNAAGQEIRETWVESYLKQTAEFCINRWQLILGLALILSLAGVYADYQVPVDTDFKNYLPQDLKPLIDFRHMSEIFGGTDELTLIVQADDVTEPETLRWIDSFSTYLQNSRAQVLATGSITSLVKAANNGIIPDDKTKIREIIDSLDPEVSSRYLDGHDTAIVKVNVGEAVRDLGAEGTDRLLKEIDKDLAWNPSPPGVYVRQTGDLVVMTTVIAALTTGRTEMTLLGLVLIFFILLVIYRDVIKALLPVLPMLVVIGWMGGVMYITGLKYTPLTATLGALILGVGSEYAILMMERFYEELSKIGEPMEALKIAVGRIGSALIASGLTTIFGFAALITSTFLMTSNFGLVTVMAVIFALLTTFTVFIVLMLRMEMRREAFQAAKNKLINSKRRTAV